MFTGIIEATGEIKKIIREGENLHITVEAPFTNELKVDQSVAHNGVCLTVVDIKENQYTVTAVDETLQRSNLSKLSVGTELNLERCMKLGARLDGHIVQGHVDTTAEVTKVIEQDGSNKYYFRIKNANQPTVEKGSITINGVSLTVVDSEKDELSVIIIPYTIEHTNFKHFKIGSIVNIEYDIIGKYVAKLMPNYKA